MMWCMMLPMRLARKRVSKRYLVGVWGGFMLGLALGLGSGVEVKVAPRVG